MRITIFPNAETPVRRIVDVQWEGLQKDLTTFAPATPAGKKKNPCWSPAEFTPTGPKTNTNVIRVHAAVLDFDTLSQEELQQTQVALSEYTHFVYSTYSHASAFMPHALPQGEKLKPGYNFRAVIKIDRPIELYEFDRFIQSVHAIFPFADTACKDPNRVYFGAFAPRDLLPYKFSWIVEKKPMCVQELLDCAGTGESTLTRDDIHALAQKFKNNRPDLSNALRALSKGQVFAEPGERDSAIFRMVASLLKAYPNVSTASVLAWFEPCFQTMSAFDERPDFVEGALEVVKEKIERLRTNPELEYGGRIAEALGEGRKHPYSPEELNTLAVENECSIDELKHRWIIQKNRTFYLLSKQGYRGPYSDYDVVAACVRDLSPAKSAGVELEKLSQQGEKIRKTGQALVIEYGSVAEKLVFDLTKQKTTYDPKHRYVVEGKPRRNLVPTYDAEVNEWLKLLCRDQYDTVIKWLALVTRLEDPCVALFFTGAGGVGKTLFAEGVARIWSESGVTRLDTAMHSFNEDMIKCPLVFADEHLPKGRDNTEKLREFIQARSRPLRRKHVAETTVKGAIRLIIAANNERLLELKNEDLTEHDLKAITDRFAHIPVGIKAKDYLLTLKDPASFVKSDRIAKLALWFSENYEVKPTGRFMIESNQNSLYRSLINSVGLRAAVCQWVARVLLNDIPNTDVKVQNGQVYVTPESICRSWQIVLDNDQSRVPDVSQVGKVLKTLSTSDEVKRFRVDGRQRRYRRVDISNIVSWAETAELADPSDFAEGIERLERKT